MNIKEIKKGDKILHSHMGTNPPVSGIVMESPIVGRGIRSTILVDVKGSEVGLFDEMGSIYTKEILKVFRDENWIPVTHGAYQEKMKKIREESDEEIEEEARLKDADDELSWSK